MWVSPNMPTTSCWITPACFIAGVFSFCRLYYINLFEVMHACAILYIWLCVITWTLMLSFERNDSTARRACGERGECSCSQIQLKQRQHETYPASSKRRCLFIQGTFELSGGAESLCHSRQQNVTPVTSGSHRCGGAQPSSWMALVAASPSCWVPVQGTGRESILLPEAALLHPFCARHSESCELQQLLFPRAGLANAAAVGGSSWNANKQCNVHAERGAMLIRSKRSDETYCWVVICAAVWSGEECLSPESRELT